MSIITRFIAIFLLLCPGAYAAPSVVVSIKPLHSLVAGVMEQVASPTLMMQSTASLHDFALKPSQRSALDNADLIFMTDPAFETFLAFSTTDRSLKKKTIIISHAPDITLLPVRGGGLWPEETGNHHAHHARKKPSESHETQTAIDYHLWLDPKNASAMVVFITRTLSEHFPDHRNQFERNSANMLAQIMTQALSVKAQLSVLQGQPFMVSHDATQYFEAYTGLHATGSLSLHSDEPASARRLADIRNTLKAQHIGCILTEPATSPALRDAMTEGMTIRTITIDPEGRLLEPGPELYATLQSQLAESFMHCLSYHEKEETHAAPDL